MKFFFHTLALGLAVTGAAATTQISAATPQNPGQTITSKTSALPIPVCPPDDPNGCKKM